MRCEAENLEAAVDRSMASTATDRYPSSGEDAANHKASSSSTVVYSRSNPPMRDTFTATSCEHVETGEIIPAISPDVNRTLPPSLLNELEQVFKSFDANEDGKISASELREVLQSLGDHATEEEAILMLKEADTDGDGYIDLEELMSMSTDARSDELRAAFDTFDPNGEWYITAEKLKHVLSRLRNGENTIKECQNMIKGVDRDGDGIDFKHMMA